MNQILAENALALAHHPDLQHHTKRLNSPEQETAYRVESARDGNPTLSVRQEDGNFLAYHSRYNPIGEAQKQVDSILSDHSHVILLGLGFGYALDEIAQKLAAAPAPHQIFVVEPDPGVFSSALANRNFQRLLLDLRIDWCVGLTPDEVGDRWNTYLEWAHLNNLAIVEHPPSIKRFHSYFERIKEKIRYLCNRSKGNLVTLMQAGSEFLTNNFLNMYSLAAFPGIERFFGKFSGVPAVVVAAGPSLERNIHLLSEVKGKFLIIAVDTAFRQLISRGIKPDIVCAGDPSYLNSLDFVGVENEEEVILAIEPMTHPDILQSFKGPKILMTFGGAVAPCFEKYREPAGHVACWGSISTTAFDMARRFSCEPIIFVGLDLSFQDGKLYARGSYSDDVFFDRVHAYNSLEHETLNYISERGIHRFPRPDGKVLYTDQNMFMYKGWFEDQFRQTRQKVINATEGGIVDQFVECLSFKQVISQYGARPSSVKETLETILKKPVQVDRKGLIKEIRSVLGDLHTIEKSVKNGLAACKKLSRISPEKPLEALAGNEKANMDDVMNLHDRLCVKSSIFSWYSIQQTKFLTKHTMEIGQLKNSRKVPAVSWVNRVRTFLESMQSYLEYQIPLMTTGLQSIETLDRGQEQ